MAAAVNLSPGFVADNEILTLNVAGPRASKEPNVAELARRVPVAK
jgi:Circularly permutated YpsA SLOG family